MQKFRIARRLLTAALLGLSLTAHASDAGPGVVSHVFSTRNGFVFFQHSGARSARPSCATMDRWAINYATPAGQALLAHLFTVRASSRTVSIIGAGTCDSWPDTEDIAGIQEEQ